MTEPDPWVAVADTAAKIGLGAPMSGFFGWLIARHVPDMPQEHAHFWPRQDVALVATTR